MCAFFALAIEEEITGGPLLKGRCGHHPIYRTNLKKFAVWICIYTQREALIEQQFAPPPNWDEQLYLSKNPDVAEAMRRGSFKSGWQHYVIRGVEEGRKGVSIER